MIKAAPGKAEAEPEVRPQPKPLAHHVGDFTPGGELPPDPAFSDAVKPAMPKKTMPRSPPPNVGALGHPL